MGNWHVFSSRGFILDFGLGAGLSFHFQVASKGNEWKFPLSFSPTASPSYCKHCSNFPYLYPVKGLRCHPKYQGMGFTLQELFQPFWRKGEKNFPLSQQRAYSQVVFPIFPRTLSSTTAKRLGSRQRATGAEMKRSKRKIQNGGEMGSFLDDR